MPAGTQRREGGLDIDVFRLIDELEQIVENGKGRFFGKVVIDEEAFYMLTTKLKKSLPRDLQEADRVTRQSTQIMSGAETEAGRLLEDAQEEAQRLRSDARAQADRMIQNAREDQDRIVEEARREAERIEADARQHAEQLVAEHTITQSAQRTAEDLQRTAEDESAELRAQANDWALARLEQLESILHKLQSSVEQGKEQLASAPSQDDRGHTDIYASANAAFANSNSNSNSNSSFSSTNF